MVVALTLGAHACGDAGVRDRDKAVSLAAARSAEARVELERGDPARAEELLGEALAAADRSGTPGAHVEPRLGLALLSRFRKDPAGVQKELALARDAVVPATPPGPRGRLDLLDAFLALDANAPDRAVASAESARSACAAAHDARCEVEALVVLANARGLFQARYEDARAAIDACLARASDRAPPGLALFCINARAHLAYNLADYPAAVRDYSLLIASKGVLPDRTRATASLNLALCRIHLGSYGAARLAIEEAIAAARVPGRTDFPLAVPVYYRGYLLSRLGDVEGALEDFDAALAMFRELGNLFYESFVLVDVGDMLLTRGLPARAREEYEQSLEIQRRAGSPRGLMLGEEGLGRCLLAEGRVVEAERSLRSALRRAEEVRDDHGWARIAVVLADGILRTTARAEARDLLERARAAARRSGLLEEELRATIGIARVERDASHPDQALGSFLEALDLLDGIRGKLQSESQHLAFSDARDAAYREAVDLVLASPGSAERVRGMNAAALAFEIAERGRARALTEILERSRIAASARTPEERRARLEILARVSRAETRLLGAAEGDKPKAFEALRAAREDLERYDLSSSAAAATSPPRPVELDEARSLELLEDKTLLVFWLGPGRTLAWRIRRDDAALYDLGPYDEIVAAVRDYRAALAAEPGWDNPQDRWREPAGRLAELLRIADLVPATPASRRATVLVVPDGPIHAVPLGPLPLIAGAAAPPLLLADVADVVVAPSVSLLSRRASPVVERSPRLFAIGDPDRSSESSLASLPGAREEVRRIGALFPPGDAEVKIGAEATESLLAEAGVARADILHIAARTLVSDERPESSGLALATGPDDDGFVHLEELAALDLNARIAVLSACRTGLGRPIAGEGLQGLARAFVVAGVPVVVPSLWDISDRATSRLMEGFYRRLLAGEPPHRALAEASRELRNGGIPLYAHPHYWAAFVHLGAPIEPL